MIRFEWDFRVAEINIKKWKCALVKKSSENSMFHEMILHVSLLVPLRSFDEVLRSVLLKTCGNIVMKRNSS